MRKSADDPASDRPRSPLCYEVLVHEIGSLLDVEGGLVDAIQDVEYACFSEDLAANLDVAAGLQAVLECAHRAEVPVDQQSLCPSPAYGRALRERLGLTMDDSAASVPRTLNRVLAGLFLLRVVSPLAWSTKRTCRDAEAYIDTLEEGLEERAIGRDQANSLISESAGCVGQVRSSQLKFNSLRIYAASSVGFALLSWFLVLPIPPAIPPMLVRLASVAVLALTATGLLIGVAWLIAGRLLRQLEQLRRGVHRLFDSADDCSWMTRG